MTINVGPKQGGTDTWRSEVAKAINAGAIPAGTIVDYMGTVAPTGWVLLQGQTITGGQTLYPQWWAVLPASMKSGADILCPDTRGRVTVGINSADGLFDAIGDTGGTKDAVVVSHAHTMNFNSGTVSADHSHTVSGSTATDGGHAHNISRFGTGGGAYGGVDTNTAVTNTIQTNTDGSHAHSFSVQSGGISANHVHNINGSTSTEGSSATNANVQPFVVFSKMARAY